jgi:hypothetical protein
MKAVQRILFAWHRFLFGTTGRMVSVIGCIPGTVILNSADSARPPARVRSHLAVRRAACFAACSA